MIRISGEDAFNIAEKIFKSISGTKIDEMKGYTATYGHFYNMSGENLDDGVALIYKAPKSYTGENVVELTCHGGVFITRTILSAAFEAGAKAATPGEFSKRAFLNGKMDLTQAESIMDLINSQNMQSLKSAKSQMESSLFNKVNTIKEDLIAISAHICAWIDYPEDDIIPIDENEILSKLKVLQTALSTLVESFDKGKILNDGIQTAIVGKPNVGKSSLMNLLSGYKKSIVTSIAGTTRDVVEENVNLGKVILRLADTAGIRETADEVEKMGVDLALNKINTAQLILAVFDASSKLSDEDFSLIDSVKNQTAPVIAIVNKTDLEENIDREVIGKHFSNVVYTSHNDTDCIKNLEDVIINLMHLSDFDSSSGIIVNLRQQTAAKNAQSAIVTAIEDLSVGLTFDAVNVALQSAIDDLDELVGRKVTESVVHKIFENFCVGK